jgi:hypothetical protein
VVLELQGKVSTVVLVSLVAQVRYAVAVVVAVLVR